MSVPSLKRETWNTNNWISQGMRWHSYELMLGRWRAESTARQILIGKLSKYLLQKEAFSSNNSNSPRFIRCANLLRSLLCMAILFMSPLFQELEIEEITENTFLIWYTVFHFKTQLHFMYLLNKYRQLKDSHLNCVLTHLWRKVLIDWKSDYIIQVLYSSYRELSYFNCWKRIWH